MQAVNNSNLYMQINQLNNSEYYMFIYDDKNYSSISIDDAIYDLDFQISKFVISNEEKTNDDFFLVFVDSFNGIFKYIIINLSVHFMESSPLSKMLDSNYDFMYLMKIFQSVIQSRVELLINCGMQQHDDRFAYSIFNSGEHVADIKGYIQNIGNLEYMDKSFIACLSKKNSIVYIANKNNDINIYNEAINAIKKICLKSFA